MRRLRWNSWYLLGGLEYHYMVTLFLLGSLGLTKGNSKLVELFLILQAL